MDRAADGRAMRDHRGCSVMGVLNPPMTEDEEDNLAAYRDADLLFRRAEQVALALLDLTDPENDISNPRARHWLVDDLCMTLGRLGDVAGFDVRRVRS